MWKNVKCAVQGRGHKKDNIPCQDKTYYQEKDDCFVSALADGAGSAKYSHFGAEHITKYMCNELCNNFDVYYSNDDGASVKLLLDGLIKDTLQKLSEELQCMINDLASTLLITAVKDDRYIIIHIGDGVIGYTKDGSLKIASQPENGEFVNTTVFTTSKDSVKTMRLLKGHLGSIDGFVIMSDGTEASLYNKREKKIADVVKKIMDMVSIIDESKITEQLQRSFDDVIRNQTTDDCSIAIIKKVADDQGNLFLLDKDKQMQLLCIDSKSNSASKSLSRYMEILFFLKKPQSVKALSRKIHLKKKYTRIKVKKLENLNYVESCNSLFKGIIIYD